MTDGRTTPWPWRLRGRSPELNIFLQPTDRHRTAQELEQDYADVVRRVAAAVKIPVSVKLPMRTTNVLAVADSLLARGARVW